KFSPTTWTSLLRILACPPLTLSTDLRSVRPWVLVLNSGFSCHSVGFTNRKRITSACSIWRKLDMTQLKPLVYGSVWRLGEGQASGITFLRIPVPLHAKRKSKDGFLKHGSTTRTMADRSHRPKWTLLP